jgi:hypothetical protein
VATGREALQALRDYLSGLDRDRLSELATSPDAPPAVRSEADREAARRFSEWSEGLPGSALSRRRKLQARPALPGSWALDSGDLLPVAVPRIVSRLARLRALEAAAGAPYTSEHPRPSEGLQLPLRRRGALRVGPRLLLTISEAAALWRALRAV